MVTFDQLSETLAASELVAVGHLVDSSNQALVCQLPSFRVVYKPSALENPLWDFPEGTISQREVSASEVDRFLGWNLIPPTVWVEKGPVGEGSVQVFIEDAEIVDVAIFDSGEVPADWVHVVSGQLEERVVDVAHTRSSEVYRLAILDAILNNADRKGGHLLRDTSNRLWAIDHGVCFHEESKLRTVLWGWIGDSLGEEEASDIRRLIDAIDDLELPGLSNEERQALVDRCFRLLSKGMPEPSRRWPAIPWPVF